MQEKLTIHYPGGTSLSHIMAALEKAAVDHSKDLHIDFDRMLGDFGLLWMLMRSRVSLSRLPEGELRVETWLRKPTAASSLRDFDIFDEQGLCGTAVQTWSLVEVDQRKLVNMKTLPLMWDLPTVSPERKEVLRKITLPENMLPATVWEVAPTEIDNNGHLNNVRYVEHGEALTSEKFRSLEVIYSRECFAGDRLTLETGEAEGFFVRGVKEDGGESFRLCLRKE